MSIPFKYIIICLLSWLRKNRVQSNLVSVICLHAKGKLEVAVAVEKKKKKKKKRKGEKRVEL